MSMPDMCNVGDMSECVNYSGRILLASLIFLGTVFFYNFKNGELYSKLGWSKTLEHFSQVIFFTFLKELRLYSVVWVGS